MPNETPIIFSCQTQQLIGIIHHPEAQQKSTLGVLIIVGGPQYRVGSHRQFVLLARKLAANGYAVMRFDYRGMGDAEGEPLNFAAVDADIAAASNEFYQYCPELTGIVLWGLCDAASAALFYAYQDKRIKGLVLLNPWVFTEQGAAKTYLKHYYLKRLADRELWTKIFSLQFNYLQSVSSLLITIKKLIVQRLTTTEMKTFNPEVNQQVAAALPLPTRMRECLRRFTHPVLLLLSGNDLTADEFRETVLADTEWQMLLHAPRVSRDEFSEADHTFSSHAWRAQVEQSTLQWLNKIRTENHG